MNNVLQIFTDALLTPRCSLCGLPLLARRVESPASSISSMPLCEDCIDLLEERMLQRDRWSGRCRVCGAPLISERETCMRCRERTYDFDFHRSVFLYRDIVRQLIRDYKFRGNRSLREYFAACIDAEVREEGLEGLPIVPAAPRKRRKKRKGWEHVDEITRVLVKRYGYRRLDLLVKKGGISQKSLDFRGRLENMQGRFEIQPRYKKSSKIEGARTSSAPSSAIPASKIPSELVFLDDVFTTGATASESARVLKEWGAEKVYVVSLAMD